MTPRQADVAFVLESVPGVRAVYAFEHGRLAAHWEFAIELEPGGTTLAAAHYALLRILTHEECERVRIFVTALPAAIARAARPLVLDGAMREAVSRRVPPPAPRPALLSLPQSAPSEALIIGGDALIFDSDALVEEAFRSAFGDEVGYRVVHELDEAVELAKSTSWRFIVVDGRRAFGTNAFLARVPLAVARDVFVLVGRANLPDARWRLQGSERILMRPLASWHLWHLRQAFFRVRPVAADGPVRFPAVERWARRVTAPSDGKLRVLLVDVEDEFDIAFGRAFGGDIEFVLKSKIEDAIEYAFSNPISVMICSSRAATGGTSFLDGIAREDPDAGKRILVAAPARVVVAVRDILARGWRRNRVLALPIEEASLRASVLHAHPALATRLLSKNDAVPLVRRPTYRRLAVLVIDEEMSTQILFSAGLAVDDADVAHETTALAAFEHVLARPVDVLFVSASMRSDGGEPFYRTLWRMKPELKARSVLITTADAAPPSAGDTKLPRILERPISRGRVAEIVAAFRHAARQD